MTHTIVALITDFGQQDGFTGAMKGVILGVYREAILADVAHDIPPQDIWHGSWVLGQVFDTFPERTVFACVVDPFVGSCEQRKLVIVFDNLKKALVLPDNGLATRVVMRYPQARCFSIENPALFYRSATPSRTFHGRDIYAPVAAHLAKAFKEETLDALLATVGPSVSIDGIQRLPVSPAQRFPNDSIQGQIDVVDTYGNIITNIPAAWVETGDSLLSLNHGGATCTLPYVSHYGAIPVVEGGNALGLVAGSHGMLEVFAPNANAARILGARAGQEIGLRHSSQRAQ